MEKEEGKKRLSIHTIKQKKIRKTMQKSRAFNES